MLTCVLRTHVKELNMKIMSSKSCQFIFKKLKIKFFSINIFYYEINNICP